MFNKESYNKVKAGILGNNFVVVGLVGCHMKMGEQSHSIRSVTRTDENRMNSNLTKIARFSALPPVISR
jgi:hypothetical protein